MEHMKEMLNTWIEDKNQCHAPVSKLAIQAKAHSIYEDLSKDDDAKPLNAYLGWFCNYKRDNFHNIKIRRKLLSLTQRLLRILLSNCSILK
jgi:hypothetical protein